MSANQTSPIFCPEVLPLLCRLVCDVIALLLGKHVTLNFFFFKFGIKLIILWGKYIFCIFLQKDNFSNSELC